MKTKRRFGIFGRVFLYTVLFVIVVIAVLAGFFANQFNAVFIAGRTSQISQDFDPLLSELEGKATEEIIDIAKVFSEKNNSFEFAVQTADGKVLFMTPAFEFEPVNITEALHLGQAAVTVGSADSFTSTYTTASKGMAVSMVIDSPDEIIIVNIASSSAILSVYNDYFVKTAVVLAILLIASVAGAFIFARGIVNPVKRLALDTSKMAELEFVPPPNVRRDEIGRLAEDVYRMYQTLKCEIERGKELEESQRYFFSAASHELKTPLAATSALIEEMLEGLTEPEDYTKNLNECMRMVYAQKKLLSEMLEIVRFEGGGKRISPEAVNLSAALLSVTPALEALASAGGQTLSLDIPEELFCKADHALLTRSLSNILMNAVQNTPAGGEIRVWSESADGDAVTLNILNTGANLDEEALTKLFEPFYRTDKARSAGGGHSGLGLTLVKKALDLMEIPFSLKNTDGGVLFRMELSLEES